VRSLQSSRAVLSGYGFSSAFAATPSALIRAVEQGKGVKGQPYFARNEQALSLKLNNNPHYVPLPVQPKKHRTWDVDFVQGQLDGVISQALSAAGLAESALGSLRVRVYISGSGMRGNLIDFLGYLQSINPQDLLFTPSIKCLSSDSYAQDRLTDRLARRYQLRWPPVQLYSASCSAMSALHLAQEAIAQNIADVVLVVGWVDFTLQDILVLEGQKMLSSDSNQPFSAVSAGVLPANGVAAIVLESEEHARRRGVEPEVSLSASASYQSSGARGSNSFSADFRSIATTLEAALAKAELDPSDIACVFPHGNGIYASDKAESMAIEKIWGAKGVPVVSYKSQLGYLSTLSGLVDVIIAADALKQQRLLSFVSKLPIDASSSLNLHTNATPLLIRREHVVKSSLGLEGSVVACVLSRISKRSFSTAEGGRGEDAVA
jgi:3-oxoacyl-(acyl-carrier-protein) synthase